jgi:hypothetical protein
LHDEEVRVVNIELDRAEEVLNALGLRVVPVDEVLVAAPNDHLLNSGGWSVPDTVHLWHGPRDTWRVMVISSCCS